jgi:hypothetical protein
MILYPNLRFAQRRVSLCHIDRDPEIHCNET